MIGPIRRLRTHATVAGIALASVAVALDAASAAPPSAPHTLDDYRHFRVASIDLLGRMPTPAEIAAFERPDFNFDSWVDAHTQGAEYADRLTRIYMDLLRLEPNLNFSAAPSQLYRHEVMGPDGKNVWIYYRENQRRARIETDGEFCLSPNETGTVIRARQNDVGPKLKKVSKQTLDKYTVLVKPWWLYRDYKSATPAALYGSTWSSPDPEYKPVEGLLQDEAGKPVTEIRVCREEAQIADEGRIVETGRTKNLPAGSTRPGARAAATGQAPSSATNARPLPTKPPVVAAPATATAAAARPPEPKLPGGRLRPPPLDKPYAHEHVGEKVACDTRVALDMAPECGCGVGLERCIPGDRNEGGAQAFYFPNHVPLGATEPLDDAKQQSQRWYPYWWSREAERFLGDLFEGDHDFREILTGKQTLVNGPLAQFYRTIQRGNCCGPEANFGMVSEAEPLFDPKNVPTDLAPHDVSTWERVADRGAHAAGLLTMPMFLEKYASARARGAVLYNAFLCKSFVADNQQLTPSTESNLMVRPGCKTCHAALEPLAAYFARIEPGSFVFLPEYEFPVRNTTCKTGKNGKLNGPCNALYDVAFANDKGATLRSAYGSPDHADATPVGAAEDITRSPEFASCAVERVTSSFLGRATTPDDEAMLTSLTHAFVASGYRMRALVRAILISDAYRKANNVSSTTWRGEAP